MEKWERDLADAIHFARKHKEAQKKQYPPQKMELGGYNNRPAQKGL